MNQTVGQQLIIAAIPVGLAIALAVYRTRKTVNVDEINLMKG